MKPFSIYEHKETITSTNTLITNPLVNQREPIMSDKKQSSIEYLGYELNTKLFYNISPELWEEVNKIFEQAKAMHKEEIEDSYLKGYADNMNDEGNFEQYYKETFEK